LKPVTTWLQYIVRRLLMSEDKDEKQSEFIELTGKFKAGDTVQLKTGGPKMTVSRTPKSMRGNAGIYCKWFAGSRILTEFFDENMLVVVEEEKK
jgi:uncharacterized protein YodC (DUF2158 family)